MEVTVLDAAVLGGVGLGTGILAGMLGIGGSIIMIPAMVLVFHGRAWDDQHLYQATAMAVNVAVAAPATIQHRRAGMLRMDYVRLLIPWTLGAMLVGVMVSNALRGPTLERVFAVFLLWAAIDIGMRALRPRPARGIDEPAPPARWRPVAAIGCVMGLSAGVLGIGGGIVAVPLLTRFCRLRMRESIAVSAATMTVTAGIGAAMKMATLGPHGRSWKEAMVLTLLLAPSALLGGYLGAWLTHRVPVRGLRAVLAVAILAAAGKMAQVW
jgi:uncharacterized membrane protein YfcA